MSNLQRKIMKSHLPPIVPSGRIGRSDSFKKARYSDFKPTMWNDFFVEKEDVAIDEKTTFRVYRTAKPDIAGPLMVLLHGGGYSALTWSHFCVEITSMVHCQCLSIDLRGHGDTITDNDKDLSAETLSSDVIKLVSKLYPVMCPPIHLVGHSMGGAIAVHIASQESVVPIIGVTVIDVVEGTALEALTSMQSFLRSRPKYFASIPNAIEWCIRSGQIKNVDSAKVSMPGQIINVSTQKLAINELPLTDDVVEASEPSKIAYPLSISEDEEINENNNPSGDDFKKPDCQNDESKKYTWRVDLSQSEEYWVDWFEGLSDKFLNLGCTKQLLLASIDGLDRSLTIGQMQGKFQLQVLARCGHAVHEDRPHEVAEVISAFLIRNRHAEASGSVRANMPAC